MGASPALYLEERNHNAKFHIPTFFNEILSKTEDILMQVCSKVLKDTNTIHQENNAECKTLPTKPSWFASHTV